MNYRVDLSAKYIEDPGGHHYRNLIRILADLYLRQAAGGEAESEFDTAYVQPLSMANVA